MKILVLGGTEFMGRTLITTLLQHNHDVTMLNRGNEYWGTSNPFGDRVHRIICDRNEAATFSELLRASGPWDAVIDFSAYDEDDIRASIDGLAGRVAHYVYISTDSVYMVSRTPAGHSGFRREADAVRPESAAERRRLNKLDSYGDGKLRCEEVLHETAAKRPGGFNFTCLRLPDVFGPYDTTDRHYRYQLWLEASDQYPVQLTPNAVSRKLSFIYSKDVVSAIEAALAKGASTFSQSYNIAQAETPTLKEYLQLTASVLGIEPHFEETRAPKADAVSSGDESDSSADSADSVNEYLPSVNFGPVSIDKALAELSPWRPTPLRDALRDTCAFFAEAWHRWPQLRAIDDMPEHVKELLVRRKQQQQRPPQSEKLSN